jgi:hypothetical protein
MHDPDTCCGEALPQLHRRRIAGVDLSPQSKASVMGSQIRPRVRCQLRLSIIALAVSALVALASPAGAAELAAPSGFRVAASNGYTLSVIGLDDPHGERDAVFLLVRSRHAAVFYGARASVTPTSIRAELGVIGRINVSFVPTGQLRSERSVCGGKTIQFDSGRYVGTIDFEGEEAYSKVHSSSASGEAAMAANLICPGFRSEGIGGHSPGARLTVEHRGPRRFEFTAMKNSPTRPARFTASVDERREGMQISRAVEVVAAPGSFDFDVASGVANVSPPKPFSGEASYSRRLPGKRPHWRGDLRVDFPGNSRVLLTGPGTRAGLVRAVVNPAHPFRVQ